MWQLEEIVRKSNLLERRNLVRVKVLETINWYNFPIKHQVEGTVLSTCLTIRNLLNKVCQRGARGTISIYKVKMLLNIRLKVY